MHMRKFSYMREGKATDNPCVSLSSSLRLFVSLSLCLFVFLSLCFFVFLCVSLSLRLFVSSLSLCLIVSSASISLSSTIYLISKTIAFFSPPRSFSHSTIKMAPAVCRRSLSEIIHDVFSVLLIILSITEHIYFFICQCKCHSHIFKSNFFLLPRRSSERVYRFF